MFQPRDIAHNSMGISPNVFLLYLGFDDALDKLNTNAPTPIPEPASKNSNRFLDTLPSQLN